MRENYNSSARTVRAKMGKKRKMVRYAQKAGAKLGSLLPGRA